MRLLLLVTALLVVGCASAQQQNERVVSQAQIPPEAVSAYERALGPNADYTFDYIGRAANPERARASLRNTRDDIWCFQAQAPAGRQRHIAGVVNGDWTVYALGYGGADNQYWSTIGCADG